MTSSATIHLHIGNALPHANDIDTGKIIALWQHIGGFFKQRSFTAPGAINSKARPCKISLDASSLLAAMENAKAQSTSFSAHQKAHVEAADRAVDAVLSITVASTDHDLQELETYQIATIFLQQLVLAANLVMPGSMQILNARFTGEGAHRYEAQNFDSRILYGARRTAVYNDWPQLGAPGFDSVWAWLESCETSTVDTALRDINKVLFTMLKVAEQRHEYSARTVLLVMYQLEVLLDSRHASTLETSRSRTRMIFGNIPEAADCFNELYEVRHNLFKANQPVHRPPLICHSTGKALREQIGQHNSAVEAGTALVIALLQDLIANNAQRYEFTESFSRQ
jgi:hypothetical protein